jgi:hypothetical protein
MAELVDALVSNTCGKPCRFDSGSGYKNRFERSGFFGFIDFSWIKAKTDHVQKLGIKQKDWII